MSGAYAVSMGVPLPEDLEAHRVEWECSLCGQFWEVSVSGRDGGYRRAWSLHLALVQLAPCCKVPM